MSEVIIKFRDHDPKKGNPTLRLTWNGNKFEAGRVYSVSKRDAEVLLDMDAPDGKKYFVEPDEEKKKEPPVVKEAESTTPIHVPPTSSPSKRGRGR